ncbi:MAG: type III pantothenate kinase [Desulfobacteraceae bacterium]|nr:type III pantothenate kinase [Desulfobacteraceae bacterium]
MLLAIDVGNTHVACGLYKDRALRFHWRLATRAEATGDELAVFFRGLLGLENLSFDDVHGVIIASVVPQMTDSWRTFSRKHLELDPLFVDAGLDTGMPVLTDNPSEVGADRLVNAVAAYHHHPGALIVVDFGTAITFDCVAPQGAYLGGAIVPGIGISLEALGQKAAKLPRLDISVAPASPIGTNTVAAIQAGILYGFGGLVDGLVGRIRQQMAPAVPKVIATGGMAGLVAPHAASIESIEPMLTLEGLRLLHERNK